MDLLILGLLGVAGYLYLAGTPASPTAAQGSPTPVATALLTGSVSPTPTLTTGPVSSTVPTTAPAPGAVSSPGTAVKLQPLTSSQVPPDSYFINQAIAVYEQGTGLKAPNKYHTDFVNMVTAAIQSMQITTAGFQGQDNCANVKTPNVSFSQVAQLGGTAATAGFATAGLIGGAGSIAATAAATAIPIIGIGVGIITLVAGIFSHHAQKVKEQAQLDCAAVNACNNAWANMQQAIAAGQLTAAQAYSGFEEIYSQAAQMLASMSNGPHQGTCNNPCNLTLICRAMTNKFEAMYGLAGA